METKEIKDILIKKFDINKNDSLKLKRIRKVKFKNETYRSFSIENDNNQDYVVVSNGNDDQILDIKTFNDIFKEDEYLPNELIFSLSDSYLDEEEQEKNLIILFFTPKFRYLGWNDIDDNLNFYDRQLHEKLGLNENDIDFLDENNISFENINKDNLINKLENLGFTYIKKFKSNDE